MVLSFYGIPEDVSGSLDNIDTGSRRKKRKKEK